MFSPDQYQLLDFGAGRKLERFGAYLLDRPAPAAAEVEAADSSLWSQAAARYDRTSGEQGVWRVDEHVESTWQIRWHEIVLELKRTDFGHLGLFPEHAPSWHWLSGLARAAARPLKVLNLFAYTGGATLALAAAGAQVTHVDAARNVVAWARRNAQHSGLESAPIRWIVEDARKFVARELRRGNRYDGVVLDPPTYGHGPQGQSWKFAEDLGPLVRDCIALTGECPRFMLLTCHTPGVTREDVEALFAPLASAHCGRLSAAPLELVSAAGGRLFCGREARWTGEPVGEQ